MVEARLLDISGVVKVRVTVQVRMLVSMWMSMLSRMESRIWARIQMRIASIFGIPRANVDAADFWTKRPFRSVCRTVCCICFPAYAG